MSSTNILTTVFVKFASLHEKIMIEIIPSYSDLSPSNIVDIPAAPFNNYSAFGLCVLHLS